MPTINEVDFKSKGAELLGELNKRTLALTKLEGFTNEILKVIDEAKAEFNKQNISAAFEKYYDARGKVEKAEISLQSDPLAWKLLWVEFGYLFFLLLLGYLTYKWPDFSLWKGLITLDFQTVWFGALGGVTIAIFGIYNHIQVRDFDPKFQLWYICKPIIGGIFGWFVYLIYFVGFVSIQGGTINTPQVAYVIAFLAGFSERFTIKMIDKLMAVLTTFEDKTEGGKKRQ